MKLKKILLIENTDFRSLPENFLIEFSNQEIYSIDPKCIVGLNGSGKSNILELIAEIFFFIEMNIIYDEKIENTNFAFEIEYMLPLLVGNPHLKADGTFKVGDNLDVKVIKSKAEQLKFMIKSSSNDNSKYVQVSNDLNSLLPNRIIGYSSGQNELLSNPFLKMRFHYIEKLRTMMNTKNRFNIGKSRMFWMDYSNNHAIVISNLLLGTRKDLKLLIKELGVFAVDSFKIVIDYSKSVRKMELPKELYENIEKLKKCSPFWYEKKDGNNVLKTIIEFRITQEVIKAFRHHFVTPQALFEILYQLQLLNLYIHTKNTVDKILNTKNKSLNISEEIPYNPEKQVFIIEKINLRKFIDFKHNKRDIKIIKYKNLSDGEHQFLQVHGSLMMLSQRGNIFLLDEPETHFNPMWRSNMVKMFSNIAKNKEQIAQDILLTTHSPFILSDSNEKNIFKFIKVDGRIEYITNEDLGIPTYGTSVGLLLEHIFGQENSMGNLVLEELLQTIEQVETLEQIEQAKQKLLKFGESIEKFDIQNKLNKIKKKLTQ